MGICGPGWSLEESDNDNNQAFHEMVKQMIKDINAVGLIHIMEAWIPSRSTVEDGESVKEDPALVLLASMPGFSFGIVQPYSEIDTKVVFGEEILVKVEKNNNPIAYKCFIEVWEDHLKVVEPQVSMN
jgi:hypothetical protein